MQLGNKIRRNNVGVEEFEQPFFKLSIEIAQAGAILIAAGAGFSADSNLKTFRDIARIPAYLAMNLTYDDICEPHWLNKNYQLFYGFWGSCYNAYKAEKPHSGYDNLFSYIHGLGKHFSVITTNIDGFMTHYATEQQLLELHGSLLEWQCPYCCNATYVLDTAFRFAVDDNMMCKNKTTNDSEYTQVATGTYEVRHNNLPRCKFCSVLLRPRVLMFNDNQFLEKNEEKRLKRMCNQLAKQKLLIIELGCGLKVPRLREITEKLMRVDKNYCKLVRINPSEVGFEAKTRSSDCRFRMWHVKERAETFLKQLEEEKVELEINKTGESKE